eukprot:s2513_g4.t3
MFFKLRQLTGLDGQPIHLAVPLDTSGLDLQRALRRKLSAGQRGGDLRILHGERSLEPHVTLREQGVEASSTFIYIFLPGDALSAWKILRGPPKDDADADAALEGMTSLVFGRNTGDFVSRIRLPKSLETMTFGHIFHQSLRGFNFPMGLQHLTLGDRFNEPLEGLQFPSTLLTLSFGSNFNQSLENVMFPEGLLKLSFGYHFDHQLVNLPKLQSLVLGHCFNQTLDVDLPNLTSLSFGYEFNQPLELSHFQSLEDLSFGERFNQPLELVQLPGSLRTLSFGSYFDQPLDEVNFPNSLETLKLGSNFNQNMDHVVLPPNLQTLTFGYCFKQSLENVQLPQLQHLTLGEKCGANSLPKTLRSLTTGYKFNQSLDFLSRGPLDVLQDLTLGAQFNQPLVDVQLPMQLENLSFSRYFNRSLDKVVWPNLRTLTFGDNFNQSLERVQLPSCLQSLTFGAAFNQPLEKVCARRQVQLPAALQSLHLGANFDRCMDQVTLPSHLQNLVLGSCFNRPLHIANATSLRNLTFGSRFNRSFQNLSLPDNLESLTFGEEFQHSLEHVIFPPMLRRLILGAQFHWSLKGVQFPDTLEELVLGTHFNSRIEGVAWPNSLQSLTFGRHFNQSLQNVDFPPNLRSLTFGHSFNQTLEGVSLPETLERLIFGDNFRQSLESVTLPNLRQLHCELIQVLVTLSWSLEASLVSRPQEEPDDQLKLLRKNLGIKVKGSPIPSPVEQLADSRLPAEFGLFFKGPRGRKLTKPLNCKTGMPLYLRPTPIQMQVWPAALCGLDIMGIAPTGSGKTLAYLLPAAVHVAGQESKKENLSPGALVLLPTRELASQVSDQFNGKGGLRQVLKLRCAAIYGGVGKEVQLDQILTSGCPEVLSATPGRLLDLLGLDALTLDSVTFLVLDEADRMLQLGFEEQLDAVAKAVRRDRQCLLFSATFPERLRQAADRWMTFPEKTVIRVGAVDVGMAKSEPDEVGSTDKTARPGMAGYSGVASGWFRDAAATLPRSCLDERPMADTVMYNDTMSAAMKSRQWQLVLALFSRQNASASKRSLFAAHRSQSGALRPKTAFTKCVAMERKHA